MAWLIRLFWAALALVVFLFAALAVNQGHIALEFLVWRTPEISVFWWLLAAFASGTLIGIAGLTLVSMKQGLRTRRLTKQLEERDQELQRLRLG